MQDLSHRIIGASMTVLNELKPGLDEKDIREHSVPSNCDIWGMKSINSLVSPSFISETT